jgi:hypothetical protein
MRRRAFTLVEMTIVLVTFSILISFIFGFYVQMVQLKVDVEARQTLIDKSHFLMEKLHIVMADYTIDYEEYFNRFVVWCEAWGSTDANGNGYCDDFTNYGNGPSNVSAPYYCSSDIGSPSGNVHPYTAGQWCFSWFGGDHQSYGQYALQALDAHNDADLIAWRVGDEDDEDMGTLPAVIDDPEELYFISYDGARRLFIRRALVGTGDWDSDNIVDPTDRLFVLQQLQLKGFDAWYEHDFQGWGAWVFDGKIDTRWCDAELGYACQWALNTSNSNSLIALYAATWYAFASGTNDGWVNLFDKSLTVTKWNISIAPTKDPNLAWNEDAFQMSPYVTIALTTQLYGENWVGRIGETPVEQYSLPLQTTFATKQFYR